ncbi:hypothetical protein V2G26_015237 [Clonostachys chloroleuca]
MPAEPKPCPLYVVTLDLDSSINLNLFNSTPMSRALDSNVKEALKHADHGKVFLDIVSAVNQRFESFLEIEVLGQSHPLEPGISYLQDENAIAIPKLCLVQAFIVARATLNGGIGIVKPENFQTIRDCTAVTLLLDPEHLTAANLRKKVLENEINTNTEEIQNLLKAEKYFVDSLLTSRLHRHSKSPTLWNHRRWIIDQANRRGLLGDIEQDLKDVVFVSGVRHPRNYYAWCHARLLVDIGTPDRDLLSRLVTAAESWCFSHHDDISGWAFLHFLLAKYPELAPKTVDKTLKLTQSFQWRNESVWCFLRGVATLGRADITQQVVSHAATGLKASQRDDDEPKILGQALWWLQAYGAKE